MRFAYYKMIFLLSVTTMLIAPVSEAQLEPDAVVVATVNSENILGNEFERAVYSVGRSSMYHGRPTEDKQYLAFRRDVFEQLVERTLLLQEARRRGLKSDPGIIAENLKVYEQRYSSTERWQRDGERMLASLRIRFEEDDLLVRLEEQVRRITDPGESELRVFYEQNPQSFTEPKQDRVSVLLLGLNPSADPAAWQAARAEAENILIRIGNGADFSEMARLHSSDMSASGGGDMGYLHEGMLSVVAQKAIDALDVGDVSRPVTVLEGIALFRLTDRKASALRPFDQVRERVTGLMRRELAEQQWDELLAGLHKVADIDINEEYFSRLPSAR